MADSDGHGAAIDSTLDGHAGRMDVHAARLDGHDDRLAALEQAAVSGDGGHTHDDGVGGHTHAGVMDGENAVPDRAEMRMPAPVLRPPPRFGEGAQRTHAALMRGARPGR